MSVVLAAASNPVAKRHLERTVIQGVEIDEIKDHLSPESLKKLLDTGTKSRIWGLVEGTNNDRYWARLVENDAILFNVGKSYVVYSRVLGKEINTELAKHLWEPSRRTGDFYDRIIFLKDFQQMDTPVSKVNEALGYSLDFKPSRNVSFLPVQNKRIENVLSTRGTFESVLGITHAPLPPQSQVLSFPPEFEDFVKNWRNNPETRAWLERKNKAFEKWQTKFNPENVDKLSEEEFRTFLGFNENQSWTGLQRQTGIFRDMTRLRRTIRYLTEGLNDAALEEIGKRIGEALDNVGDYRIAGLGRALVTGIMHIYDTKNRIAVWNTKIEGAFKKLGLPVPKDAGSKGQQYLGINQTLTLIGRRFDLNLRQVDMLMFEAAERYVPGATYGFAFVIKDFDSCTGKKDDARYLSRRFKELLEILKVALGDRFADYRSYFSPPHERPKRGQKRASYKDHMWLGFAHPKFDRAQEGIQFQVSINKSDPISINIWIDRRAPNARKMASTNAEKNKGTIFRLLKTLNSYNLGLYEGYEFDEKTASLNEEIFQTFLDHIKDDNTHVHIGKILSKKEALSRGSKIVQTVADTFNKLYPIYVLLVGQKITSAELTAELTSTDRFAIAHLITGRNVIFYGPPGTGKTRTAVKIAELFCGNNDNSFSFETANAEWTAYDVVGGPTLSGERELSFRPGFLTWAAIQCTNSLKTENRPHFLIIDEINRANLDLAFGKIFSLLDVEYRNQCVIDESELSGMKNKAEYSNVKIPSEFRILATMNTYDTALLFSLGYAFRRRFGFVEVGSPFVIGQDENYALDGDPWQSLEVESKDLMADLTNEIEECMAKKMFHQLGSSLRQALGFPESFDLSTKLQSLNNRIKGGEFEPFNPYKLACNLSEIMTRERIIEAGYAQAVDVVRYALVYTVIFPGDDERTAMIKALDEAVKAYLIPQVEYYLPSARRKMTIGTREESEEATKKLDVFQAHLEKLGLQKSSGKVSEIISCLIEGKTRLI